MSPDKTTLLIPKIENGIVIDHIPAGQGLQVLEVLSGHDEIREATVAVGINLVSAKLGRKDVVKLWQPDLPRPILQHIALVAPGASIKRVRDYQVDKKYRVELPEVLDNLVRCRNPSCMTNVEAGVATRFICVDCERRRFKCAYCERQFDLRRLPLILPSPGHHGSAL